MPHINVHISGNSDAALTLQVARKVTALTSEILGKKPEVTAVVVHYIPRQQWIIDNTPLSEQGKNAFHLDISVTDETNTKHEKARYLKEIYASLSALIGNLHEKSYIHVFDVRAATYGYGGLTQEYRYQHA